MAVTMREVAERAGVSVKTVSNVLSGHPHVRPATSARVLAAVDELGYRLNVAARSLRSGRTRMLMLAVPELSLPYFAELADAVITAARGHGYTVLVNCTDARREAELEVLSGRHLQQVDGVLFSPLALGPGDAGQLDVPFPMVLLGERILHGPVDHVTMANVDAARAATEHLLQRGRRSIACVGTVPGQGLGSAALRTQGYLEALAAAGIETKDQLLVDVGPWHRAEGASAVHRLVDAGVTFDAIFALNDALAVGALFALRRRGLRVPDDVAVIGFDNVDEVRYGTPTLSTVDPGRDEIARAAVNLLVRRLEGQEGAAPVEQTAGFRIVARESTNIPSL